MHKVRTARGDIIDFNEMVAKQQLSATPPSIEVQARNQYVEQRLRRRSRRKAVEMTQQFVDDQLPEDQLDDLEQIEDETVVDQTDEQPRVKIKRG